ncbi:IS607 family element RNA-guided endonuclease TnpB [Nocardia sp. NPDC051570]|uniref:IS607 family element RNA-guided endonuclease TnpB n=1 Tax=Nocardia sp. NPDC051570 TaxID=3364324 RepID=UPI0037A90403
MSGEPVRVLRAYRFALDPTPGQVEALRSHCGAQRFAYNWGLGVIKANLGQRAAEDSYDVPDDERTPPLNWSAYSLRKTWNRVKDEVAPWWSENSKEAYSSGLANLAAGLANWSGSKKGDRKGKPIRFPRFKGRKTTLSCRFTTGAFGLVDADRRHVKLPRIGVVRTLESTRKLARHIERGTARIRSATLSHRRGRWFVSFSVEVDHPARSGAARPSLTAAVGVDLGIAHLAVLSRPVAGVSDEHGMVANPKHLDHAHRALRRLQRRAARPRGPDKRTAATPSKRWEATHAKVNRLHTRVANARADSLHRLTTGLAEQSGPVVVEDLNVAGMLRNRRLARHIADTGWGELRRQLEYKTAWRGGTLIVADRWFPSSKTCSNPACGAVKAKLRLSQRIYRCDQCGLTLDRDVNAARCLAALAASVDSGASSPSCGATENEPDGNPHKSNLVGSGYRHGKTHAVNVA